MMIHQITAGNSDAITIVLAEDDDGHASLVKTNLDRAGLVNNFVRARDGMEAVEILEQAIHKESREQVNPLLLLLDIKMPRMDGIEVLERIKRAPQLNKIPVIMLSTTDDPREIDRCYALGCNVYITKPIDYDKFIESVRRLGLFLQVVHVPKV